MSSRPRPLILRIVSRMAIGGVQNGILETLKRRDRELFDYAMICTKKEGSWAGRVRELDVPVTVCRTLPPAWHPFRIARLARAIRVIGPDLVHVHLAPLAIPGVAAARLAGVKRIVVHHHSDYTERHWAKQNALERRLEFALTRRASAILAVSASVARATTEAMGLAPGRAEVIVNGIDLERFEQAERRDPRAQWGLAPGTPLVMQVSRFLESKRIEDFIDAAAMITERWPERIAPPAFVIAGDGPGPLRRQYEARIKNLARGVRVILAGGLHDLPEILGAADVAVLATEIEGCPNTILEYMAAGLPIATTNIAPITEIVNDGKQALLCPPRDPAALAANIERLLMDRHLANQLGAAAKEKARAYSWDRAMSQYEAVYKRLLDMG